MKTKTIITDIEQEDLVDLLSTATYGSSWFAVEVSEKEKSKIGIFADDCIEDIWAKVLLNEGKLFFCDHLAEGEVYGNLPAKVVPDTACNYTYTRYQVTLKDIKNGLQKALDAGGHSTKSAMNLINIENSAFDAVDAETLVQWIMFGEEIYG